MVLQHRRTVNILPSTAGESARQTRDSEWKMRGSRHSHRKLRSFSSKHATPFEVSWLNIYIYNGLSPDISFFDLFIYPSNKICWNSSSNCFSQSKSEFIYKLLIIKVFYFLKFKSWNSFSDQNLNLFNEEIFTSKSFFEVWKLEMWWYKEVSDDSMNFYLYFVLRKRCSCPLQYLIFNW